MRKRFTTLTALILALALAFSACGIAPAETASPAPTPSTTVSAGTDGSSGTGGGAGEPKSITIAAGRSFWQGPTTNIYVHGSTNVWESLVMLDDSMNAVMQLADSVTVSSDGLTWTIKLKSGISFHDGSELDSETAIYNLDRLYHFNTAIKAYDPDYQKSSEYGQIVSMDIVDNLTFTVTHASAIPDFDLLLAYEGSAMFALASFDESRAIQNPIGTGPYKYKSYDEGQQILTLSKFEGYRLGEPKLDEVRFQNIADATARLAALKSGAVDVISDVGGIMPQQAGEVLSDSNLILAQRQVSTVHYICMNTSEGRLFNSREMRNALSLCVDRETIVGDLLLGYGAEAVSVLTDISSDWTVDCGYSFDPAEAKALKESAVGGDTQSAVIVVSSALTGRWPYQDVALMLQAQLREIGVEATIETVDAATWSERLKTGDYDISLHPFTVSAGEPNYFFTRNMRSTGANNIARGYGISDAELDGLIDSVATEPDKSARQDYYRSMQQLVKENDYIIPAWYDVTLYAMNKRVQNFEIDVIFCPNMFAVDVTD